MLWTEVRKWAKEQGFDVVKEKDDSLNGASYYWAKSSDHQVSGISLSVSKLAKDVYNAITDSKWVAHQETYQEKQELKKATLTDY